MTPPLVLSEAKSTGKVEAIEEYESELAKLSRKG